MAAPRLRRARVEEISLGRALGLGRGWRAWLRRDEMLLAISQLISTDPESLISPLAQRIGADLACYRS